MKDAIQILIYVLFFLLVDVYICMVMSEDEGLPSLGTGFFGWEITLMSMAGHDGVDSVWKFP